MGSMAVRPGTLLIDALVGLAVFAMIVTGVVTAMLLSQSGVLRSADRISAVYQNQKAIAAVRAIRDTDFAELTEGTYGIDLESGAWALQPEPIENNGYATTLTITSIGEHAVSVSAETEWNFGSQSAGSSTLVSQVYDWRREQPIGDWSSVSLDGAYIDEGTPLFNDAATIESYAFVTSETSDGGDGLYVLDISDTSNPVRTAETFNLGYAGHDALAINDVLYVVTEDPSQEIRMYDLSNPDTLSATDLVGSINIPTSAKARTIAYYNGVLFVGALEDSTDAELYAYDVSDVGSIAPLDDLDDTGASYFDMVLHDGYAYIATSSDTMELRVIDIFDPSDMSPAPGDGYNVSDTNDATSIVAPGSSVILGRNIGSVSDEFHLFDVSTAPVPSAPSNAEAGADVTALAVEPTGSFTFAANNHTAQEFIVLDNEVFASGVGSPIIDTYDTETGDGRGVFYDLLTDRVLFMTNTAVLLLQPS